MRLRSAPLVYSFQAGSPKCVSVCSLVFRIVHQYYRILPSFSIADKCVFILIAFDVLGSGLVIININRASRSLSNQVYVLRFFWHSMLASIFDRKTKPKMIQNRFPKPSKIGSKSASKGYLKTCTKKLMFSYSYGFVGSPKIFKNHWFSQYFCDFSCLHISLHMSSNMDRKSSKNRARFGSKSHLK